LEVRVELPRRLKRPPRPLPFDRWAGLGVRIGRIGKLALLEALLDQRERLRRAVRERNLVDGEVAAPVREARGARGVDGRVDVGDLLRALDRQGDRPNERRQERSNGDDGEEGDDERPRRGWPPLDVAARAPA